MTENSYAQAKQRLPLKALIERYGDQPVNGNWRSFPTCPFCGKRTCCGVSAKGGFDTFKCFKPDCRTGMEALNEIGYVAVREGLSQEGKPSPAFKRYLEMAGVWREKEPGEGEVQGSKSKVQSKDGAVAQKRPTKADGLVAELRELLDPAIALVRTEGKASIAMLQRKFELGHAAASKLMAELERLRVVGPAQVGKEREVYAVEAIENPVITDEMAEQLAAETEAVTGPGDVLDGAGVDAGKIVTASFGGAANVDLHKGVKDKVAGKSGGGGGSGGGTGDGGDGGDEEDEDLPENRGLAVLRAFYAQLGLDDADREMLKAKRGFTDEACLALGFRSNRKGNVDLLEGLRQHFDEADLEASGLFMRDKKAKLKPNSQFYGWGLKGKDAKGEDDWGWTEPVLIPYFNGQGDLIYLRPHKGGLKGKPPRVYVARDIASGPRRYHSAVVTEGEFKAGSGWLVFEGSVAPTGQSAKEAGVLWIAIPGISQAKNWSVWTELQDVLDEFHVEKVVVAFDNEDKGNPALASFKADKRKRYDTIIWSRFLAERLVNEGYDARVCVLPDEWRDDTGKADWDGILARERKRGDAWDKIRDEWLDWLQSSTPVNEFRQAGFFDAEEDRIIKNGLAQLWYKPELPHGDDKEKQLGLKLKRLAKGSLKGVAQVGFYADQYMAVVGWYYTMKKPTEDTRNSLFKEMVKARNAGEKDLEWFYDLRLKGVPTRVADFKVELQFVLVRHDGKRDRIVNIKNAQGEVTKGIAIDARSLTRPSDFREWLTNHCNATWMAGEKELQMMQRDMNHAALGLEVYQVTAWGWHEASKIWFAGDCAVAPDGSILYAGEDKVFWHDGLGYLLSEKDHEGENYRQGKPMFRPDLNLDDVKINFGKSEEGARVAPVLAGELGIVLDDLKGEARMRAFFQEYLQRLYESLGGYEAFMVTGLTLACAAAPEIYDEFKAFPGQWMHGQMGEGKTTAANWLMSLIGFNIDKGGLNIRTKGCSEVGMLIAAQQYSNLLVWFEEFRAGEVDKGKEGVLHAGFNRDTQSKKTADGNQRHIRSAFIVTGESTSHDAATRSRYGHCQVAKAKRLGTEEDLQANYQWLNQHREYFVVFFRELLKDRKRYVGLLMSSLKNWIKSPVMRQVDARSRLVHGVAFAGMEAAVAVFESHPSATMHAFRHFLSGHCVEAVEQVQQQVNINQFWQYLMDGYDRGAFGYTKADKRRHFKVEGIPMEHAPMAETQKGWVNYRLFINYTLVISAMREWLRLQQRQVPLEFNDLQDQLKQTPYWIGGKKWRLRFQSEQQSAQYCWAIDLDKHHEMGYRPASDEEMEEVKWRDRERGIAFASDKRIDPRLGPLHGIATELEEKDEPVLA